MTTRTSIPTAEEVLALPAALVVVAPPEWEDENGQVKVSHYYDLHLRGAAADMVALGLDAYREQTGLSPISVEQHIRFLGEEHAADEVSVHLRGAPPGVASPRLSYP